MYWFLIENFYITTYKKINDKLQVNTSAIKVNKIEIFIFLDYLNLINLHMYLKYTTSY